MKREVLSLKSIYKFLTLNDYPVYSEGIIKKDHRVGLTLTRFCHENILIDFKNRKCGRVIWRTEGGRNRYISEICNRSMRLSIYREYAEEIMAAADYDTVLRQIRQFMSFLLERQYHFGAFNKKVPVFVEMFHEEDAAFNEDAVKFFKNAIEERKKLEGQGVIVDTFCCGWILTFFLFHALMGNGEAEDFLNRLRTDNNLSLTEMLKHYLSENQEEKNEVIFLTGKNTELSCPPLKPGHFFGREAELFELREMLMHRGAYLISGMGGIGKTELMRQFLKCCQDERLADYICVVQYEGGLAKSIVKAFPKIHGVDANENFKEALTCIREHGDKRVLIIVDNMDGGVEETELEAFRKLPATIFVTSRYQKMKGFKTYRLKSIGKDAGSLIFRDNYGMRLSEEDREILNQIVSEETWCHTLTLRLLARTAKNNSWTMSKLHTELNAANIPSGYADKERYEGLKQLYGQMYTFANLSNEQNALLRVIAALPYRNYEVKFVSCYLKNLIPQNEDMEATLEKLWVSGWLEKSKKGYAMHPFIAECVLSVPLTEKECAPFFNAIISSWGQIDKQVGVKLIQDILYENDKFMELDRELLQVTMLLHTVVDKVSGKLTEKYIYLYLLAMMIEGIYYGISKNGLRVLEKIHTKATALSKVTTLMLYIMLCSWSYADADALKENFQNAVDDETIPDTMKFSFADVLANRFYHIGRMEESEQLGMYVLENCKEAPICMAACYIIANLAVQKGDFTSYGEWLQKGIEIGHACGREQSKDMQLLLSGQCDLYMAMGRFDEAEALLDELESISSNKTYFLRQNILQRRGNLSMYRGAEGYGVELLKESCQLAETLYGDSEKTNYAIVLVDLAMAYNKAKQFENAAECYRKAFDIYSGSNGYDFEKHRILNNMSVMYLDRGMPKTAMEYLPEAYERAKVLGGLALGETANNLSKAWHVLKDPEKEFLYLEEAVPILEQAYGNQHPKVVDAKERLEKL